MMGIVNLSPDSFYDGGTSSDALSQQIDEFNAANVDIIDIGAESSRPGSSPISSNDEINRLRDGLAHISSHSPALISVDTYKAATADFALSNGATIINDITGGESDDLLRVVQQHNASIVLMHKQGSPDTMQNAPHYTHVIDDVKSYLSNQIDKARSFGITSIIVDPGIGFGKTLEHNLLLLKHLNEFQSLGCPILIGTSNKSFIGHLTNADVHERVPGSIASALATYEKGARIFRVHNVKETQQAFQVYRAIHE
ncbi:dihydropteroate synthase [Candidatus Marinamargulisbacteria bacterium SCGC AG-343-K17]|nr:dihydropteroate synthase [Candidatus Marinamargulisbacteria bacterium SCGC AG-343-K17]